jgi:Domain of unknown function (DUF4157)
VLEHARKGKRSAEPTGPVSAAQGKTVPPAHLGVGPTGSLAKIPRWAVDNTDIVSGPRSFDPHSPVGKVGPLTQYHDQVEMEGDGASLATPHTTPVRPSSVCLALDCAPHRLGQPNADDLAVFSDEHGSPSLGYSHSGIPTYSKFLHDPGCVSDGASPPQRQCAAGAPLVVPTRRELIPEVTARDGSQGRFAHFSQVPVDGVRPDNAACEREAEGFALQIAASPRSDSRDLAIIGERAADTGTTPTENERRPRPAARRSPPAVGNSRLPHSVQGVLDSPGQPLDAETRAVMKPHFDLDLTQVRVHADHEAARSARILKSRAYTVGNHVVLATAGTTIASPAGRALLGHELAHVAQQRRSGNLTLQRAPDAGLESAHPATMTQPDDPEFQAWARRLGTPITRQTPYDDLLELMARYDYETGQGRRARQEAVRRKQRETRNPLLGSIPQPSMFGEDEDPLKKRVRWGWSKGLSSTAREAEADASLGVPLERWLSASHGADSEQERLTYMRHYLSRRYNLGDEETLLDEVVKKERAFQEQRTHRAEEKAAAMRPSQQLEDLKRWSRRQLMNPIDNFEPGIAFYNLGRAQGNPNWMDKNIRNISQDNGETRIDYTTGQSLAFPARSLDFSGRYSSSVIQAFARVHKASGRLIPFVIYRSDIDIYADLPDIDTLSPLERSLMAVPYMLTPAVQAFYAQDPLLPVAVGLLNVLELMAIQKAVPLGSPLGASAIRTAGQLVFEGGSLGRAALNEVVSATTTFGFTPTAAAQIVRSATAWYLQNAVATNLVALTSAQLTFEIFGQESGLFNVGDELMVAVHTEEQAAQVGVEAWRAIRTEISEIDENGRLLVRVRSVESISEDAAKSEYDLGKKVIRKAAASGQRAVQPGALTRGSAPQALKAARTSAPQADAGAAKRETGQTLSRILDEYSTILQSDQKLLAQWRKVARLAESDPQEASRLAKALDRELERRQGMSTAGMATDTPSAAEQQAEVGDWRVIDKPPGPVNLEPKIKGDLGEVAHQAEKVQGAVRPISKVLSPQTLQDACDALIQRRISLKGFVALLPKEGAGQLRLPTTLGGYRIIDHVYLEGEKVVFRESKNYAGHVFSLTDKTLLQLDKDLGYLAAFKDELRIEWRITARGLDDNTAKKLDDLVRKHKEEFSYVVRP